MIVRMPWSRRLRQQPAAPATASWFHVSSGLYFRRNDEGAVQIGRGSSFDDVEVIQTIEPSSWASVVASVSAAGETYLTYRAALAFHQDVSTSDLP